MQQLDAVIQIYLLYPSILLHVCTKILLSLSSNIDGAVCSFPHNHIQKRSHICNHIFNHHSRKYSHQGQYKYGDTDRHIMLYTGKGRLKSQRKIQRYSGLFKRNMVTLKSMGLDSLPQRDNRLYPPDSARGDTYHN